MGMRGTPSEYLQTEMGQRGFTFISSLYGWSGNWWAIQCIEDTVFAELDAVNDEGDTIVGETIPKLMTIKGHFTKIRLTSGAVIAYKMYDAGSELLLDPTPSDSVGTEESVTIGIS